jgi:hypothetical protein
MPHSSRIPQAVIAGTAITAAFLGGYLLADAERHPPAPSVPTLLRRERVVIGRPRRLPLAVTSPVVPLGGHHVPDPRRWVPRVVQAPTQVVVLASAPQPVAARPVSRTSPAGSGEGDSGRGDS